MGTLIEMLTVLLLLTGWLYVAKQIWKRKKR